MYVNMGATYHKDIWSMKGKLLRGKDGVHIIIWLELAFFVCLWVVSLSLALSLTLEWSDDLIALLQGPFQSQAFQATDAQEDELLAQTQARLITTLQ